MRFMMLIKSDGNTEAGLPPSEELLTAIGKYNGELVKAGVLLAAEGLQSSSKGARVRFANGSSSVVDGPFGEGSDLVAGFWLIQVKSKEEAIEWARRCPLSRESEREIEIRQVFEASDFAPTSRPSSARRSAAAGRPPYGSNSGSIRGNRSNIDP